MTAQMLPGLEEGAGLWQVRTEADRAALALVNRHYPRRNRNGRHVGQPGRKLVFVTPCEQAVWVTHWPQVEKTYDGLNAWRCATFRREPGTPQASALILAAMDLTAQLWADRPADGWVTWIDRRKVRSANPGYCYKLAGWTVDREWKHRHLVRLRAVVAP